MKRVVLTVATLVAACSMSVLADGGIGIVDMKAIFSSSPKVKSIKAELTKQFQPKKENLEKMGKTLQSDIEKYQKNKDVMNKKDLATLEASITKQESDFRSEQAKFQQEVFDAQNKSLNTFMDNVKTAVKAVAEKEKLDLVIPSNDVLYTKDKTDITQDVLKNMK